MKGFQPKDLLFIDKMITPSIITILYWIACVIVVVMGVLSLFQNFMMGLLTIVGGLVVVRLYCEILMVFFKINDNTKKMADALAKNQNNE